MWEPYKEGHWAFTESPYWKDILERLLFVQSCTNKGPLCGGPIMEITYQGPIYGCPIKRAPLQEPYEEGAFEMMREGPFWIVFFCKRFF